MLSMELYITLISSKMLMQHLLCDHYLVTILSITIYTLREEWGGQECIIRTVFISNTARCILYTLYILNKLLKIKWHTDLLKKY